MTPAARIQAVIEILAVVTAQPLDRQLKAWFRDHRFAGSKDRRAITDRAYTVFRNRAAFAYRMAGEAPRALAIASLLAQGEKPEDYFIGGYGPAPLSDFEKAAVAAVRPPPPLWVQGEYPEFLEDELVRAFGAGLLPEMAAFQLRAPVDLRVNTLKTTRDAVVAALQADAIACETLADIPDAIRCAAGVALTAHPLFEAGDFEIQDAAAQKASLLADAKPGMAVLDIAAGAGGKSLALAAAMRNAGEIVACDVRGAALFELERRAARAGATIIRTHLLGLPPRQSAAGLPFDIVFVDAPCSGSGTWRRQPELKWRLTAGRLADLADAQRRLLAQAGRLLAPGGRLVYATCSVLPSENQDRVAEFLAENPQFSRLESDFHASPASTASDGFFAAMLGRI